MFLTSIRSKPKILVFFFITFAFLFFLGFIDSDPSHFKRFGDVGDEGYWVASAKNLFLHGSYRNYIDNNVQAHIGAPLHTLLVFFSYLISGISIGSARIVSIIFAVLVFFIISKLRISTRAKLLSSAALFLSVTYQSYATLATPVIMQAFFELITVAFIVNAYDKESNVYAALAGLGAAFVICTKLSGYIFIPVPFLLATYYSITEKKYNIFINFATTFFLALIGLGFYYYLFLEDFKVFFQALGSINAPLLKHFPFVAPSVRSLAAFRIDPVYLIIVTSSLSFLFYLVLSLLLKRISLRSIPRIYVAIMLWLTVITVELCLIADKSDRRVFLVMIPASLCFGILFDSEFLCNSRILYKKFTRYLSFVLAVLLITLGISSTVNSFNSRTYYYTDSINKIKAIVNSDDCIDGVFAHWYSAGTLATPIWFSKAHGYDQFNGFNLEETLKKCRHYYLILGSLEGLDIGYYYRNEQDINQLDHISKLKLFIPGSATEKHDRFYGTLNLVLPK